MAKRKFEKNIEYSLDKISFIGNSNAWSTPELGCFCKTCNARRKEKRIAIEKGLELKENRLRTSLFLESEKNVLIDCGPDFKEQYERFINGGKIDAILITHAHNDHIGGFDDLSPVRKNLYDNPILTYASKKVWEEFSERFGYLIGKVLEKRVVEPEKEISLDKNLKFVGIEMDHGGAKGNLGYIFTTPKHRIGYTSDFCFVKGNDEYFNGLDLLIAETNWFNEPLNNKAGHMSFSHLLGYIKKWSPKKTYCTHFSCKDHEDESVDIHKLRDNNGKIINTPLTYRDWESTMQRICSEKNLPTILPAYDGLIINLNNL